MKTKFHSLFMVILLLVATVPVYALDTAVGADLPGKGQIQAVQATKGLEVKDGIVEKNVITSPEVQQQVQGQTIATFWMHQGEGREVAPGATLTYVGPSDRSTQKSLPKEKETQATEDPAAEHFCIEDVFTCPDGSYVSRDPKNNCQFTCPGTSQGGACELFEMTYSANFVGSTVAQPINGETAPPAVYGKAESTQAQSTFVNADGSVSKSDSDAVYTQADAEADVKAVNTKDVEAVTTLVTPSDVTKEIVGETKFNQEVVKEDDVKVKSSVDAAARDALMKQITDLALIIGRQDYIMFSFNEDKLADALVGVLQRKGVHVNRQDPDWETKVKAFIKYNDINAAEFTLNVRNAQGALSSAQIHTYNALLYIQANDVDKAGREYQDAQEGYTTFKTYIGRVQAEIDRWQNFPQSADGTGDVGKEKKVPRDIPAQQDKKSFCLVAGEVGYPVMLYDQNQKEGTVLVGYTAQQPEAQYGPLEGRGAPGVMMNAAVGASKQGSEGCVVKGDGTVPAGTRLSVNGVSQYCDAMTKEMQDQKADGAKSENSYECTSNESRNGICVNSLNFIEKIWKSIISIFGF